MVKSTEDGRDRLTDLIIAFISETIYGHERGFYRAGLTPNDAMIQFAAVNYLNGCYKSLILKDDEFVITKFKEMTELIGHSEVCLLNIIAQLLMMLHLNLDRSKIDRTTLETLSQTVETEVKNICQKIREMVKKSISHECHGDSIESCDPNVPLFELRTESPSETD